MKKGLEKRFIDKTWKKMTRHLDSFLQTSDQEELHHFRVEVKKLRAFIIMAATCTNDNTIIKHFRPIKKIFREAGEIRDSYLNLKLAKTYQISNEQFEKKLQLKCASKTNDLQVNTGALLKQVAKTRQRVSNDLKKLSNNTVAEFYHKNLYQISSRLSRHQFNTELHNCRKQIKFLFYNYDVMPKALKNKLNLNIDYLDRLQTSIGQWHDHVLAVNLLADTGYTGETVNKKLVQEAENAQQAVLTLSSQFWKRVLPA